MPLTTISKWVDDSKDRASGDPDHLLLCAVGGSSGDLHPSPKNADGILPRFHPSPVPDIPRQFVPRRRAHSRLIRLPAVRAGETARETSVSSVPSV